MSHIAPDPLPDKERRPERLFLRCPTPAGRCFAAAAHFCGTGGRLFLNPDLIGYIGLAHLQVYPGISVSVADPAISFFSVFQHGNGSVFHVAKFQHTGSCGQKMSGIFGVKPEDQRAVLSGYGLKTRDCPGPLAVCFSVLIQRIFAVSAVAEYPEGAGSSVELPLGAPSSTRKPPCLASTGRESMNLVILRQPPPIYV